MNDDFTDIKQVLSELSDKDKYIRTNGLDKLKNHPDAHEAISLLKNIIKKDPIPFLRRLAICIYPDIDPLNSYSVLIDSFENEKHETVIREIALVLFSLKSINNSNIEKLLSSFKDYNVSKKYWILVFLRNKDSVSDEVIEELTFILKYDKSAKIRSNAALTLSYLNIKAVEDEISIESKKDDNKKYRFEFIYALIKLSNGDDKYISQFEKNLFEMKVSDIYLKDFYSLFIELNIKHKFEDVFKRYSKINKWNKLKIRSERKLRRKEKTQGEETKENSLAYSGLIETQGNIDSSFLDLVLNSLFKFQNNIDLDSALKDHIRSNNIQEKYFRDYFGLSFRTLELSVKDYDIASDIEAPNVKDGSTDLVIFEKNTNFQISISFKIWKRNFDKNPPVEQLLEDMGTYDKQGVIYMINPNKKPIDAQLKQELIEDHKWYIKDSYKEISIKGTHNKMLLGMYTYKMKERKIYFLICDLFNFI